MGYFPDSSLFFCNEGEEAGRLSITPQSAAFLKHEITSRGSRGLQKGQEAGRIAARIQRLSKIPVMFVSSRVSFALGHWPKELPALLEALKRTTRT